MKLKASFVSRFDYQKEEGTRDKLPELLQIENLIS